VEEWILIQGLGKLVKTAGAQQIKRGAGSGWLQELTSSRGSGSTMVTDIYIYISSLQRGWQYNNDWHT